ncbi:hypothetical protein HDV06_005797 [Boothiomyces sp. JEL0866]|nr:hypothetical protein HDV06_005797 [Boothiomyces sp. JEL0866]
MQLSSKQDGVGNLRDLVEYSKEVAAVLVEMENVCVVTKDLRAFKAEFGSQNEKYLKITKEFSIVLKKQLAHFTDICQTHNLVISKTYSKNDIVQHLEQCLGEVSCVGNSLEQVKNSYSKLKSNLEEINSSFQNEIGSLNEETHKRQKNLDQSRVVYNILCTGLGVGGTVCSPYTFPIAILSCGLLGFSNRIIKDDELDAFHQDLKNSEACKKQLEQVINTLDNIPKQLLLYIQKWNAYYAFMNQLIEQIKKFQGAQLSQNTTATLDSTIHEIKLESVILQSCSKELLSISKGFIHIDSPVKANAQILLNFPKKIQMSTDLR